MIENLESYYLTWKKAQNIKMTLSQSLQPREKLSKAHIAPLQDLPPAAVRTVVPTAVSQGLLALPAPTPGPNLPSIPHSQTPTAMPIVGITTGARPDDTGHQMIELSKKRVADSHLSAFTSAPLKKKPKGRSCGKCGWDGSDCKGSGNRTLCKNACRDCGSRTCYGRNSKKPTLDCENGWIGVDGGKPPLHLVSVNQPPLAF